MSTLRELILDDLYLALQDISEDHGYLTTPALVERVLRSWSDVGTGGVPWIGYAPGLDSVDTMSDGVGRWKLPVYIVAHFAAASADEHAEQSGAIERDILDAVLDDPTRGGAATSTTLVGFETTDGDPDIGGTGTLLAEFEVVYHDWVRRPAVSLLSAEANGTDLTITYDRDLDTSNIPAAEDFEVLVEGSTYSIDTVSMAARTVTLQLSTAVAKGEVVKVSYTAGVYAIQTNRGRRASNLTDQDVTNVTPAI